MSLDNFLFATGIAFTDLPVSALRVSVQANFIKQILFGFFDYHEPVLQKTRCPNGYGIVWLVNTKKLNLKKVIIHT